MEKKIFINSLSAKSLFKILFIGHVFSIGLLITIMGVFSLLGYETVAIDGVSVVGLKGLFTAIIMAAVFSLILSSLSWIFIQFGNWVYTRFKPLTIIINEADKQ